MKFGQNLPRNQVPEWAASYINYKGLKKLIKAAQAAAKQGTEVDLAGFFFALDRNLEDVDGFYNKKYGDSSRRLKLLHERYGDTKQRLDGIDRDEAEDLMGALLELRGQLRKLQWFGEVNRRGFIKITKKLDKKIPGSNAKERYLQTKVDPKPFASHGQLSKDLNDVNDWLSGLGETKVFDDTGSVQSSASLKRVSSKAIVNLPKDLLDTVDRAIRSDDVPILTEVLLEAPKESQNATAPSQALLLNLLQRSISCRSNGCIDRLLRDIDTLDEDDDLNQRNCIHRLVIAIGRTKSLENQHGGGSPSEIALESTRFVLPAESPIQLPPPHMITPPASEKSLDQSDDAVQFLVYLLDQLRPQQRSALQAKDAYGRLPLHYAAQYGVAIICQEIIKHMQDWGQFEVSEGIDAPQWQDSEGYAPLHLSVIGGHVFTTRALLDAECWQGVQPEREATRKDIARSGAALALATKSNCVSIARLLVDAGVDINYQDAHGETALHIAARFGHDQCAQILISGTKSQKADLEIAENTFSWTPLFIACVEGSVSIVEQLITAGANLERIDSSGWTAKEHAALRGNMDISRRLAEFTTPPRDAPDSSASLPSSPKSGSPEVRPIGSTKGHKKATYAASEPVKTFGHRYLTKDSVVLVSLGSMDSRKDVNPIKLDQIPLADAHATQLDTALSVVISASGASGEPTVIDLPVQENVSTDPVAFTAPDLSKVKLLFDIVPTYAGIRTNVIGRGVALLSSLRTNIGSKRSSLHADVSIPIVAASTLEVIGSVNFNFLIVTPFSHSNMTISEEHTYWKKMASTMVIGHRGLGKNVGARKSLQLGENTIQSFIAAANLGASYVEFDVQMTKDLVPVIYHDFLVSETGIDAPVHTLTLEQFLHVGSGHAPNEPHTQPLADIALNANSNSFPGTTRRRQSFSAGMSEENYTTGLSERMKHTRDFKAKGFKGNSRGHSIKAPFTTLEEMFKRLPESVGFNIEMKYPMLFQSEEQEMDSYAVELNSFVDTVLAKVYDLGGRRNIIFSSFNPEMCILLSLKQPSIPILFLTDAGATPAGDIRAGSLQEAIRFAVRWNLLGVVSAAEPLVQCPRLVKVVKESGLVCVTYGTHNNDPENVKLQVKEGIDAVIVDSVLAIRKGLTGLETEIAA
ncbi:MAG: Glycerophosphocholine phosphodiesterase [Bathelium mastoideum]|nr:MAG: Glycerophosphocholine phosphodiesterase [Bathelium mastoideum]